MKRKWTEVPAGDINAANQRLWEALDNSASEVASRINTDPNFVKHVAQFMVASGFEPTTSQKLAREIMGGNYFGIREAKDHFGIQPKEYNLDLLANIPWSEKELRSCKDTHILLAVFPISIICIRNMNQHEKFPNSGEFRTRKFMKDEGKGLAWHLIRKTPIPNDLSLSSSRQDLPDGAEKESTPSARVVIYAILGHLLNTNERLYEELILATASSYKKDERICITNDHDGGIVIQSHHVNDVLTRNFGMASERIPTTDFLQT